MSITTYFARGSEVLDWEPALHTSGLVVIDTLPATKSRPCETRPAFEVEASTIDTTNIIAGQEEHSRNGQFMQARSSGNIAFDHAVDRLAATTYPDPLKVIPTVLPLLDPKMIVRDEDRENARKYVDKIYAPLLDSKQPENLVIPFELNGLPDTEGLGSLSSEILLAVISNQRDLHLAKARGEYVGLNILPVFIVKQPHPFSRSSEIVTDMFVNLVTPDVEVARVDTRSFQPENLVELFKRSGRFGDDPIDVNHPVVKEVVETYGGNASLAFHIRNIAGNTGPYANLPEFVADGDLLSKCFSVATSVGSYVSTPGRRLGDR